LSQLVKGGAKNDYIGVCLVCGDMMAKCRGKNERES